MSDEVEEVAAKVANVASSVGSAVKDAGEEVVHAAEGLGHAMSNAYNSDEAGAILGKGFGALEQAYTMSADEAKNAMKMASGIMAVGCASVGTLLKAEIVRDFLQIVASVMNQAYKGAKGALLAVFQFFGTVANVITLNLGEALRSETAAIVGFILAFILALSATLAYFWLIGCSGVLSFKGDELRGGKEVRPFHEVAEEKKKTLWYAEKIILLCLTVYLPIGTYICQVIFCDTSSFIVIKATKGNLDCVNSEAIAMLRNASYFVFIIFLLPLPIFLGYAVKKFMPTDNVKHPGFIFDADGELVEFTDEIYTDIIENDIDQQLSPFRSLYQGFERKFAHYKVGMLVWKLFLLAPAIALNANSTDTVPAAIFQLIILILQAVGFWYMSPFVDANQDTMDASGRITAACVAFGGMFSTASSGVQGVFGVLIMIVNLINTAIMAYYTLVGFPSVQLKMKNFYGNFTFSDSTKNQQHLTAIQALSQWNCHKEVKHRVWQSFWNGLILKKCSLENDDVPKRLLKLQKDTVEHGLASIEKHWAGERDANIQALRQTLRLDMEGVDMYWNDTKTLDGQLDSTTFFGYLIVTSYPFEIRIAYDEASSGPTDVTFISENEDLQAFVALNNSPEIQAKRSIRKNLRIMSKCGTACHWPFSRYEKHIVPDGYDNVMRTDSNGNSYHEKKVHMSTVDIEVFYTVGYIKVGNDGHSLGFDLNMLYNDGHGHAIKPHSGEPLNLVNQGATMPPSHFDCDHTFTMSAGLRRLFDIGRNDIDQNIQSLLNEEQKYRSNMVAKEKTATEILGDGFWYFVYNDYKLDRATLERYLIYGESNPILQKISVDHSVGLDYLYKRLAIISLSDANEVWYVFWEDFWHQNNKMDILKDKLRLFDIQESTAIPYRPLLRKDLEKQLKMHGLMYDETDAFANNTYCCFWQKEHFSVKILDALYAKMEGKPVQRESIFAQSSENTGVINEVANPMSPPPGTPAVQSQV